MRAHLYMNEEISSAVHDLPRRMSASKLFRHLMNMIILDDTRWEAYMETVEGKAVRVFLKEKAGHRF